MSDRVQAVERALSLLEAVAASPVPPTAPELAKLAGINRGTAWRLLNTLEHFDLVEKDPHSGRYSVSYGAVRLAAATDTSTLVRRAHPVLERVSAETGGGAFLEVASRGRLIVLDHSRPDSAVQVDLAGVEVPLHCGSVGKLYLASLSEPELEEYLSVGLERCTPRTVTDPVELRSQIEEARVSGVAVNYMEHRQEWCGITAAIRDGAGRDLAYLNVTLPTYSTTHESLLKLAGFVRTAANEIRDLQFSRQSPDGLGTSPDSHRHT
jgi:DNA-binding IclR family transcriptional regulator